ncbi:helix-turn-helix domain-containing protein [Streptomyces roseifaciens]
MGPRRPTRPYSAAISASVRARIAGYGPDLLHAQRETRMPKSGSKDNAPAPPSPSRKRDRLLTPKEAADRLAVSHKTLYRWASEWEAAPKGPAPLRTETNRRVYRESDVDRYIEDLPTVG